MASIIRTSKLKIDGMSCLNCQHKIEKKLRKTAGVRKVKVSYSAGTATINYDEDITSLENLIAVVEKLGYQVPTGTKRREPDAGKTISLLITIAALYILLEQFGLLNLLAPAQLADARMGYGMMFVIGLVTSVHCVAMCGGINLSQCIPRGENIERNAFSNADLESGRAADGYKVESKAFAPAFLYNLGRVVSYTAVGFIVGALGAVITFTNTMQGVLKLLAGVFMVIMGVNMLGIFPWLRRLNPRMPSIFARKINNEKRQRKSALIVGLLNGLMPCGPLQAMQIYALSTGNPFAGALSMFLFSLGTVPLMFGLGAFITAMGKRFAGKVMMVGAVLVCVLGLSMFTQGFRLTGLAIPSQSPVPAADAPEDGADSNIVDGVQIINSTLGRNKYPDITVVDQIPVKWVIDAPEGSINGCNGRLFISEYGIEHTFTEGENVIEFTPTDTGTFPYSCWMGMIRASITVTDT